jgi:hypothetical protein
MKQFSFELLHLGLVRRRFYLRRRRDKGEATSTGPGVSLNTGLRGIASGGNSQNLGIQGIALGNAGTKFAGDFIATGSGDNYGIKASAYGGANN